jgi:hypothetical protein
MNKKFYLVLFILPFLFTSCIASLFDKKNDPEPAADPRKKFEGTWNLTRAALDANNNNIIDNNEYVTLNGMSSQLSLTAAGNYTFTLTSNGSSQNFSGTWTLAPDESSLAIKDGTDDIRFTIRSASEIVMDKLNTAQGGVWLIYSK